jgi:hypothetical protein
MDRELEKYYEAQFALFAEPGWRDFIQQVNEMLAATNDISGIDDAKALHYRQGECSIMRWIISWEPMVREAHKQLMEDENGTS